MAIAIASIVFLHVVSLACLLLMARHSAMLVDEEGRPLLQRTGWHERVIPRRRARPKSRQRH